MSRTDKTNPWWLSEWWEPAHRLGCPYRMHTAWQRPVEWIGCNLPDEPPRRKLTHPHPWRSLRGPGDCVWVPDTWGYYSRRGHKLYGYPRAVSIGANQFERGVRAAWRQAKRELLTTPREYIDDVDIPDPRHRHFAIWDIW